ncbi:hypothetical protein HQ520_17390, partial [bacterium]|nr:hypothetical protein [bacterium]
ILDVLDALNTEGKTIIMVTHDENIAARAHRVVRLIDGRIVENFVRRENDWKQARMQQRTVGVEGKHA